ncbi:uncharacterized protein MONBRDRAFT_31785 [Monosiga brevicollis MX1]|uniref:MAM domain-containing protein n=1 Tax=Monosiga brevicollis TaxID=81824 RepID=A9UUN4_MONBE|nr:uncharacterized protein MONBRDRAFT_31785 [Monosiga brevicollis MX1]EDQ91129.1 predicted protein [Monosiga brevicollis MX1]|eukprot:XP_001744426.1 hypothetical protein [Monosiga brevicollis MX1]
MACLRPGAWLAPLCLVLFAHLAVHSLVLAQDCPTVAPCLAHQLPQYSTAGCPSCSMSSKTHCGCETHANSTNIQVCGADGLTYDSICLAHCAGVAYTRGACLPGSPGVASCTKSSEFYLLCERSNGLPVCYNGTLYQNEQCAWCALNRTRIHTTLPVNGACPTGGDGSGEASTASPCICPENYQPVCGSDLHTYGNACQARCHGATVLYDSPCSGIQTCADPETTAAKYCMARNAPRELVCGDDGRQYYNTYCAECNGVLASYGGYCATGAVVDVPASSCTADLFQTRCNSCPYPDSQLCQTVCVDNMLQYSNVYCAQCAGHSDFTIGTCHQQSEPSVVISSCLANTTGIAALYTVACHERDEDLVCSRGATYRNRACAICNGLAQSEITAGECDIGFDFVGNCTHDSQDHGCTFFDFDPVCGLDTDVTYKNFQCAQCNGVRDFVTGPCNATIDYQPCDSVECPSNAECTRTVADCDFGQADSFCGWTRSNVAISNDPTLSDVTVSDDNQFAEIKAGQHGTLVSPWMPTILFGYNCVLNMYVWTSDASDTQFATHIVNSTGLEESDTWIGQLVSQRWQLVRVPIRSVDTNVTVRIEATAPTSGRIALDNIELACGEATEGECACLPGYMDVNNATEAVQCVVDSDEIAPTDQPPVVGVDTCTTDGVYADYCHSRDQSLVCGVNYASPATNNLTLYKNEYCAACNGVDRFSMGLCSEPPISPTEPPVQTCTAEGLAKLASPTERARLNESCLNEDLTRYVCYDGVTYKNEICLYCSVANFSFSHATSGACGTIPSATEQIYKSCALNMSAHPELATYEAGCLNSADSTNSYVCANDRTYANRNCAICSGYGPAAISAGPCSGLPENSISTCADGSIEACRWFENAFVCGVQSDGSLATFMNPSCARCNGVSEYTTGTCADPEPAQPCDAVQCAAHATCKLTIADADFESGLGGWDNSEGDDLTWYIGSSTPSAETGPALDHTYYPESCILNTTQTRQCPVATSAPRGHFAYIEASGLPRGPLSTAYLLSPMVNPANEGYRCRLNFWYHTFGRDIKYLAVDMKRNPETVVEQFETLWQYEPSTPGESSFDVWRQHSITLAPDSAYDDSIVQLRFHAGVTGPEADIAIDDVALVCDDDFVGSCVCDPGYSGDGETYCIADPNEYPASTLPPTAPVKTCPSNANFLTALLCRQNAVSLPDVCDEATDTSYASAYCAHCNGVTEFRRGRCDQLEPGVDIITTCPRDASPIYTQLCYTMPLEITCYNGQNYANPQCAVCNGASVNEVNNPRECGVNSTYETCSTENGHDDSLVLLCSFSALDPVCANGTHTVRSLPCAECLGYGSDVIIGGVCGQPAYHESCADLVCPAHSSCARTVADCNFEGEDGTPKLCGWTNDISADDFDWKLGSNGTYTAGTGPSVDHTYGTAEGHFMYIDASGQQSNHFAQLTSPKFNISELGSACHLSFYYHMLGQNVENLTLEIQGAGDSDFVPVWVAVAPVDSAEPSIYDRWRHGQHWLTNYEDMIQLRFKGFRGDGVQGDIGLDDIEVVCDAEDFGDCKCDAGYSLDATGACTADLTTALGEDARFTNLTYLITTADIASNFDGNGPFIGVLPTDDGLHPMMPFFLNLSSYNRTLFVATVRALVNRHLILSNETFQDHATFATLDGTHVSVAPGSQGQFVVTTHPKGHGSASTGRADEKPFLVNADGAFYALSAPLINDLFAPIPGTLAHCHCVVGECYVYVQPKAQCTSTFAEIYCPETFCSGEPASWSTSSTTMAPAPQLTNVTMYFDASYDDYLPSEQSILAFKAAVRYQAESFVPRYSIVRVFVAPGSIQVTVELNSADSATALFNSIQAGNFVHHIIYHIIPRRDNGCNHHHIIYHIISGHDNGCNHHHIIYHIISGHDNGCNHHHIIYHIISRHDNSCNHHHIIYHIIPRRDNGCNHHHIIYHIISGHDNGCNHHHIIYHIISGHDNGCNHHHIIYHIISGHDNGCNHHHIVYHISSRHDNGCDRHNHDSCGQHNFMGEYYCFWHDDCITHHTRYYERDTSAQLNGHYARRIYYYKDHHHARHIYYKSHHHARRIYYYKDHHHARRIHCQSELSHHDARRIHCQPQLSHYDARRIHCQPRLVHSWLCGSTTTASAKSTPSSDASTSSAIAPEPVTNSPSTGKSNDGGKKRSVVIAAVVGSLVVFAIVAVLAALYARRRRAGAVDLMSNQFNGEYANPTFNTNSSVLAFDNPYYGEQPEDDVL